MYYLQDTLDDDEPYDEVYDTNNLTHDMNTWFKHPPLTPPQAHATDTLTHSTLKNDPFPKSQTP